MYPLYYTLNVHLRTTDLKKSEKEEILQIISTMDSSSKNAVILLIVEHLRITDDSFHPSKSYGIPYEGKKLDENLYEFDLAKLPIKLRRILYKFVQIYKNN